MKVYFVYFSNGGFDKSKDINIYIGKNKIVIVFKIYILYGIINKQYLYISFCC